MVKNSDFRRYRWKYLLARLTGVIKVLVVDDQPLMRSSLECYIRSANDVELIGSADDGAEALRAVETLRPDVVLMDLLMPVMNGIEATLQLSATRPEVRVLAITTYGTDQSLTAALQAGAVSYLVKDAEPDDILAAVRQAYAGEPMLP